MKFTFKDLETGDVVREYEFTLSQKRFWDSDKKFVLFSGGYGCGKSLVLTLKAIDMAIRYPKNYILMGRRTYRELNDTLVKEFFGICPEHFIKDYLKSEGRVLFKNGSEIIFRHLDTIAESEIRSLNLGCAFIDQAEDIPQGVVIGLRGRLRRDGVDDKDRRIYLSCNPSLSWLFAEFKQNPQPEYEVIEASTLENAKNLPQGYVEDLLKYPESYKKQYVYGVWDEGLLSDKVVFAREYQERLSKMGRDPVKVVEGLSVFKEYEKGHHYQMGIDCAEGEEKEITDKKADSTVITIADLTTLEEVAAWSGRIPPDVAAEKAAYFARMYQDIGNYCLVVAEMNSIGLALVNKLKQYDDIFLFQREEYDKTNNKKLRKYGWRTTRQTKPLLVAHFQELLRKRNPKVYSKPTIEEFKSFIYTDVVNKKGMGAQEGFHDDRIISLLLAFWEKDEAKDSSFLSKQDDVEKKDSPFLIKDGILYPRDKHIVPVLLGEPVAI